MARSPGAPLDGAGEPALEVSTNSIIGALADPDRRRLLAAIELGVDATVFSRAASATLSRPPSDEHAGETPARRKVLDAFVRDGRITAMPTAAGKREIVLDWLAGTFEVGRRYAEAEVNTALDGHAEDHVSLRRALVDAGMLDRDDRAYWRCGGTVD
jgi:hypothetical protein